MRVHCLVALVIFNLIGYSESASAFRMASAETMQKSPEKNFYEWVNDKWLNDPNVVIPSDYPRWGSFLQLVDESFKNQIVMLEAIVERLENDPESVDKDQKLLATVWKASLERFKNWEEGVAPDYSGLEKELEILDSHFLENKLSEYFAHAQSSGFRLPVSVDKEGNLEDSDHVVLTLSPGSTSLPSRSYYLDEKFQNQRDQFVEHLKKVQNIVPALQAYDDFAERVVRFETKLACIGMTEDQKRMYDKYYTISSLKKFISDAESLNSLPIKLDNYPCSEFESKDHDSDILTDKELVLSEEDKKDAESFFGSFFANLKLPEIMKDNFEKNYGDVNSTEDLLYRVMVFDGDYLRRFFKLINRESNNRDLQAYFAYGIVRAGSSFCGKDLDDEVFDFYSRKLQGQKEQKSPEKRSVSLVNAWMGELMGKIYVEKHFSIDDKKIVSDMIGEVVSVMDESIRGNDWLTAGTKESALDKLSKFKLKIGFPEKWKDYSDLTLNASDSLFDMDRKVTFFSLKTELFAKINKQKDKTEWEMTPQTVNAYFSPLDNEIVFPAAIIQPPFYQRNVEEALVDFTEEELALGNDLIVSACNFGGIAAVIAHEITHGFDDQGKKFSGDGNLQMWWTPEDEKLFEQKSELMIQQAVNWTYIEPETDPAIVHNMNGKLTLGENLADLGGLSLAVKALSRRLLAADLSEEKQRILTRLFFKNWATGWRSKETTQFAVKQLTTDPHAPSSFRGNVVKNIDQFYEVFDIPADSPMYLSPEKRLQMW